MRLARLSVRPVTVGRFALQKLRLTGLETIRLAAPKAHARGQLPTRRHAGDALSPRLGSAIHLTPGCPDGQASQGANDGSQLDPPAHARFEPLPLAGDTR